MLLILTYWSISMLTRLSLASSLGTTVLKAQANHPRLKWKSQIYFWCIESFHEVSVLPHDCNVSPTKELWYKEMTVMTSGCIGECMICPEYRLPPRGWFEWSSSGCTIDLITDMNLNEPARWSAHVLHDWPTILKDHHWPVSCLNQLWLS